MSGVSDIKPHNNDDDDDDDVSDDDDVNTKPSVPSILIPLEFYATWFHWLLIF